MATRPNLTVWTFRSVDGARAALELVRRKSTVAGAAIASWTPGWREPETRAFYSSSERKRLWSEFFRPVFYARERTSAFFEDLGVDQGLIVGVRNALSPGTSSLFVLTNAASYDELEPAVDRLDGKLVHTTLPTSTQRTSPKRARTVRGDRRIRVAGERS